MKLKVVLSTASALALLTGAAWAGSGNNAFVKQDGAGNTAKVQQAAGSGGNDFGTAGAPALQQGNGNSIVETQSTGGGFSRGDNDTIVLRQVGNSNSYGSDYSNSAGGNRINSVIQNGNSNHISIGRNAATNSTVETVLQSGDATNTTTGSSNWLSISQSNLGALRDGNRVVLVQQLGSNNGAGSQNAVNGGTTLSQSGANNVIMEATINGDNNNPSIYNSTFGPVLSISQKGTGNGYLSSIARMTGSNGNFIHVTETGDNNNFYVVQGIDRSSTQNRATVIQTGSDNDASATSLGSYDTASITEIGNSNHVKISQSGGDTNTATANITGNFNGSATVSGIAGNLASANGLVSGDILQVGANNTATYTVLSSDNNQFAYLQQGSGNTIDGTVTGTGSNQVAVVQVGAGNTTGFSQAGGGNNGISVSQ
ncbi:MAG: hypothetical protein WBA42_14885 [Mesorhizobium sp.]